MEMEIKMKNKLYKLLLTFIIIVTFFFRFYNLSSVPPQATVDEVSIGYNAYSILKTGKDEYGTKFPILLRAYDDWRPALYVYLVIPFIAAFGLDIVSVRLPAVILSTFSVVAIYFLLKELFKNSKVRLEIRSFKLGIPEIATLLLAISPWHIYISRLGHEVNASFAFLIFGLLFFFRFVNKRKWNLYLSAVFFALSFDSYQSTKLVAPLVLLVLGGLYLKRLIANKKTVIIAAIIGFIITLPILSTSFDQNALIRFRATNLLAYSVDFFENQRARIGEDKARKDLLGTVFDNRKVAASLLLSKAYLSHLDPQWLFLNEGSEQFKAPSLGLLYLFELPLIVLGLLFITRIGIDAKNIIFILAWAAIAIIPGAITTGYAHPMRIFSILPIPQIFAAIGFIYFLNLIRKFRITILATSLFLLILFVLGFFHSYFTLVPRELSQHFQYGVLNALSYAKNNETKYSRIVVSNRDRLFESYMFYLYSHKIDPVKYQVQGGTRSGGFAEEHKIDKYEFGSIEDKIYPNTLYVINPNEFKSGMTKLTEIPYLDGKTSLILAETP